MASAATNPGTEITDSEGKISVKHALAASSPTIAQSNDKINARTSLYTKFSSTVSLIHSRASQTYITANPQCQTLAYID